jgi:hypothetical protein
MLNIEKQTDCSNGQNQLCFYLAAIGTPASPNNPNHR